MHQVKQLRTNGLRLRKRLVQTSLRWEKYFGVIFSSHTKFDMTGKKEVFFESIFSIPLPTEKLGVKRTR